MIAIFAVAGVAIGALGLGFWGVRLVRTTSDLYVASRAVTPWWNAAAISGEYLSAASFLGIAGLEMKLGTSALWLPIGFASGYLALLFFVAAPLRRFGAYTIPDFAEARLGSPRVRIVAAAAVLTIGGFYLVPQLKGAGLTLEIVAGMPYWLGVVLVAAIVALTVALGGMRGVTYVQAFQYWVKTFGIALPACLLLVHLGGLPERSALFGQELPRAPAGGLVVKLDGAQKVEFPRAARYRDDGRPMRAPGRRGTHAAGHHPAGGGHRGAGGHGHEGAQRRRLVPPGGVLGALLPRVRVLAAAGHVPGHHGAAPHPGPLPHQPRRPGGAPDDRARAGAAGHLLRVPRRLRRAGPGAHARAVPGGAHRRGGAGAADGRLARARGRDPGRHDGRRRVRGVHLHGVGADGVDRRHAVVRPGAPARAARGGRTRRRAWAASGEPPCWAWWCRR